ncbi:MAG: sugar transferase [Candidatus Methanomethylicaceae archaeon]
MMRAQLVLKRFFDILICSFVLVLGLPLFGLIALLVKLSSPGPVFFVQERVGLGGRTFRMIKFRTMKEASTTEPVTVWTEAEEARITKIGRFLRDYALDELPEIINVLKGDMSIVGPRPPLPAQVQNFTERQLRMFRMRPGMLSLAFINGRRSIPMEQRIEYHIWYVENWSLWLDILIFWRGLLVLLTKQGASEMIRPSEGN